MENENLSSWFVSCLFRRHGEKKGKKNKKREHRKAEGSPAPAPGILKKKKKNDGYTFPYWSTNNVHLRDWQAPPSCFVPNYWCF